jgi:glutathione S-transferase
MSDLVFYTNPMSRGRTVRWMLEEIGRPYETVLLDYETTLKSPDYLAINPMGKVPAIKHGDTVVTESAAICAYLADAFPQAGLAPPLGDRQRGPYFRWLFFTAGPLEYAAFGKRMDLLASADQKRMVGYGCYEDVVNAIEGAVSVDGFLCGDQFSAADLYVAAFLGFATGFGMLPQRDAITNYVARATDRPAYRRANEIDGGMPQAQQQQPQEATA